MKKIKISILSVFILFSLLGCQTIKQKTDAIVEKENKKELIPFNFGEVIKKVSGDLIIVDWHT